MMLSPSKIYPDGIIFIDRMMLIPIHKSKVITSLFGSSNAAASCV